MKAPVELFQELKDGNRAALARAITLIESKRREDLARKRELLSLCENAHTNSVRIAVSGLPGAGKSTFIEQLGLFLIGQNHRVAVLAIDPSSDMSGGSILGDKTRMERLSARSEAFIRPSPNSGVLGGVAEMTRESILVCEAAGYDVVLVETVGVGQAEFSVRDMTDMFILVMFPGGGDVLQGIKRGIMEVADLIVVNKADGDRVSAAKKTASDIKTALKMMSGSGGTGISVLTASSLSQENFHRVWQEITDSLEQKKASSEFEKKRHQQRVIWFDRAVEFLLRTELDSNPDIEEKRASLKTSVAQGDANPIDAAAEFVKRLLDGSS